MEYVTNPDMGTFKRLYSNLKDSIAYFGLRSVFKQAIALPIDLAPSRTLKCPQRRSQSSVSLQRTPRYASVANSLRPCWDDILSILRECSRCLVHIIHEHLYCNRGFAALVREAQDGKKYVCIVACEDTLHEERAFMRFRDEPS